ncbi:MoaD/ThiS family protein [Flavobacteriaceae bacterium F08102]|nr:MoaD/ThiS family protein [Flavobacteriaceae bacterium F08102]
MKIKVLFFGVLQDVLGVDEKSFTLEDSTSVNDFKEQLLHTYPALSKYGFSIAVNETYCNSDFQLQDNHVVALIPPVSGG